MLLKPALTSVAKSAPASWQELPHGQWLRSVEREALAPSWASMAGQYVLQLGPLSEGISGGCKASEKVTVHNGSGARVRADLTALPFSRRSVDIAVLGHVLEYYHDPHQILRETDRVLAFDGYIVLTVFNPLSVAVLTGLWPPHRSKAPWRGRYFSKVRMEDWLGLLNYEVVEHGYVGNSILWPSASDPERGHRWLLQPLAPLRCCYYIIARKRVFPLRLQPSFMQFAARARAPETVQAHNRK